MENQQTITISGIKKTQNAEESARKIFQTTFQIISHFKRESDKNYIYDLTSSENSLTNLLTGSSAIHCYHNLGIRTQDAENMLSDIESASKLEKIEKKELFNEINQLIGDTINYELELSSFALKYEEEILDNLIEDKDIYNEDYLYQFKDKVELHLVESLNKYPHILYYDHIGYLTGLQFKIKNEILEQSAGLKSTSLDLEKDLVKESKGDEYLELETAAQLVKKMKKSFEFNSIKDLQLETFPFRKILNEIITYRFNLYPISKRGLKSFREATSLKYQINDRFSTANKSKVDYNKFELETTALIASKIQEQAFSGPNHFIYFLQNLLEKDFGEIYQQLQTFGVHDIPLFCDVLRLNRSNFIKATNFLNLNRIDIIKISKSNSIFQKVEQQLNKLKKQQIALTKRNLIEILEQRKKHEIEYVKDACKMANISFEELEILFSKKITFETKIKPKFPLLWNSGYILLFDLANIFQNLAKYIFYHFFSKICTQFARVLETFIKLKEDTQLYLIAIRRILETSLENEWVMIKIEELIIERLMNRQEELATVFNGENRPFFVNGFILARLLNTSLSEAIKDLKNEPSHLYEDILELGLPEDIVSPKSYVIAFDILKRLEDIQELKQYKKEQIKEEKKKKLEQKKEKIREARELTTLNWIDKKIISSLKSITTKINPTQMYWSEKDQKICIEKIVQHSELKNRYICDECGFDTTEIPCLIHTLNRKEATPYDLFIQFMIFSYNQIKKEFSKLRLPDIEDIKYEILDWLNEAMIKRLRKDIEPKDSIDIIEGERIEVAKEMATTIGQFLDKAIYKKFKLTLKKSKKNNQTNK